MAVGGDFDVAYLGGGGSNFAAGGDGGSHLERLGAFHQGGDQLDGNGCQGEIVNILLKIKNSFLPTKQILIGL